MNSSLSNDNSIGGMAGSMAGKLPYNHLVFKGEDPRSNLVGICFQVLCVLLDFQSGNAKDTVVGTGENQTSSPTARTNEFRYFLVKLVSHIIPQMWWIISHFDRSIGLKTSNLSLMVLLASWSSKWQR